MENITNKRKNNQQKIYLNYFKIRVDIIKRYYFFKINEYYNIYNNLIFSHIV